MTEKRFIDLETKIAFQEKIIKDLNDVLYEQQKEISKLITVCGILEKKINILSESSSGKNSPANEKPPHY